MFERVALRPKRAGRRSVIVAIEAVALSNLQEHSSRIASARATPASALLKPESEMNATSPDERRALSIEEDQRQADPIDLKVVAQAYASVALKPRQLSASGPAEYLPGGRDRYHKYCSSCVNEPADRRRRRRVLTGRHLCVFLRRRAATTSLMLRCRRIFSSAESGIIGAEKLAGRCN
jgi:hypothetical protein